MHRASYVCSLKQSLGHQVSDEIRTVLVAERQKQGVSLNRLAERAGIDRVSLGRFESDGRYPTFWYLFDVANGLGLDFAKVVAKAQRQCGAGKGKKK